MLIFDQLKRNDSQLRMLTWIVLIGMVILFVGLYYVQVIASKHFVRDQEAQSFRTVRIPAVRGKILDRLGRPLAENRPSYDVCLYLDELRGQFLFEYTNTVKPAYLSQQPAGAKGIPRSDIYDLYRQARYLAVSNIAQKVSVVLNQPVEIDPEDFHRHYNDARALPMPIVTGLDFGQLARFQEQPSTAVGVDLNVQPHRLYPYREAIAHVLGYLRRDTRSTVGEDAFVNYRLPDFSGEIGIEKVYDHELRGKGGVKSVLVNSLGYRQSETIWTPAEPGKNVVLTLNLDIQLAAYHALTNLSPTLLRPEETTEVRGAVVVLDPRSGDVLAMVSAPSFDPNMFIPGISTENYKKLLDKERLPQTNRGIQGYYHPGSIFKIVTGLACLENGLDPNRKFYNPGHIWVGRRLIDDLAKAGHYDFRLAFMKSSNTYFITNGLAAGPEAILRLGQRLHLGERSGVNTGQEVPGNFPAPERARKGWYDGDTANLCIGQGPVDMTVIQVALTVAAVANGGHVLQPRLVMRLEPQDPHSDEPDTTFPSGVVRNELGVSARTLEVVQQAMLADVTTSEGTGRRALVPDMVAAGKTGTAEVTDARGFLKKHITWFASYAPFEQPRYVVVVMIESGVSGGEACAPVARKIYQALLDLERGIPVRPLTMVQRN